MQNKIVEMKVAVTVFTISIILVFALTAFRNQYAAFLPILFLYIIATISLLFLNYIGWVFLRVNISVVYPFSFVLSLLILVGALTWLSGNTFIDTVKSFFLKRKDIFSMADPYIIANVVTYILLLK